jgi:hypothetical protein
VIAICSRGAFASFSSSLARHAGLWQPSADYEVATEARKNIDWAAANMSSPCPDAALV